MSFITFNTRKKAEHYIKHKNKMVETDFRYQDGESFCWFTVKDNMVLRIWGWRCGCGCDRGSTDASVIGKIKS